MTAQNRVDPPTETSVRPSGANATDQTMVGWPSRTAGGRVRGPLPMSQIRAVWSQLPVATVRPSGPNVTEVTASVWPRSTST
nr:hypothetical protein [Streptomyces sp. IMTB 2501]